MGALKHGKENEEVFHCNVIYSERKGNLLYSKKAYFQY